MTPNELTTQLTRQYFTDLKSAGREDNDKNLQSWLWFTCPADMRVIVEERIEVQREAEKMPLLSP